MSNVRVSNGSPSLERMDGRPTEYPKPSACRNLFGPVNHEELSRDLEKHCRDMEEASQRKWNFDFQNHRPLEGKYEWQEVEKGHLPEFYYRPPRPPKGACKGPAQESQDVSGSRPAAPLMGSPADSEDTHLGDQKPDPAGSQPGLAEQCGGIRKRPGTDDSAPQNKKANRTEDNVSEGSPNAGSVEQTPKKPGLRRRQTFSRGGFLNLCTIDILDLIILFCGAVLCVVGCLAASLASTHQMPAVPSPRPVVTTKDVSRNCQMSPGDKIVQVRNYCSRQKYIAQEGKCWMLGNVEWNDYSRQL